MAGEAPQPANGIFAHHQIIAGATAGLLEVCLMYPLDLVKTRQMLNASRGVTLTSKSDSVSSMVVSIIRKEGFWSLYRGIGPPILMEAPKRALKFTVNGTTSPFLLDLTGRKSPNFAIALCSGLAAGLTEAFVVAPFEKVKIRMQSSDSLKKYISSLDCLKKIVRGEGILALLKGLHATMFCQGIWNATYFGTIWAVRNNFSGSHSWQKKRMIDLIAGSTGGFIATIAGTPFDMVKSRVQKLELSKHERAPHPLSVLMRVGREEGYGSWYKGFKPKAMRLTPGGGILIVVFEQAKDMF